MEAQLRSNLRATVIMSHLSGDTSWPLRGGEWDNNLIKDGGFRLHANYLLLLLEKSAKTDNWESTVSFFLRE